MVALLPTRFVPGLLLGAAFACVGIETGLLVSALLHKPTAVPTHWVALPVFAIALIYVRKIWRDGFHQHPIRRITALSPRSQAIIFVVCLGIGLSAGAVIALSTIVQGTNPSL
jgi:hypothetical protein